MCDPKQHPSCLALDRYALGVSTADVATHVESCPQCRAYVQTVSIEAAPESWVRTVAESRSRLMRRWWSVEWWFMGGGAVAAAAVVLIALMLPILPARDDSPVRAKGGAAVAVFVKRGEAVRPWDGRKPIRPGDALRLQVAAGAYAWITVLTPASKSDAGLLSILYEAAIDGDETSILPAAWHVDAQPEDEVLYVVLTNEPLAKVPTAARLTAAMRSREAGVWVRRLVLPKERTMP